MSRIALNRWELRDFDVGLGSTDDESEAWVAVSAPGDTYRALIEVGRLNDPFHGRAEAEAAWVRDREWWWRTTFIAPADGDEGEPELVFEGLDTFAEIFLDGVSLGRADNMFHGWRFGLAGRLRPGGEHRLAIRFDPTALALEGRAPPPPWAQFTDRISRSKRNLMRKAQFGWGWDWGPDLPTVGVWKPAFIETRPVSRIEDVRFAVQSVSDAVAQAVVHIETSTSDSLTARIELVDPTGATVFSHTAPADEPVAITIDQPRLWWTAALGDQPLYDLHVRLMAGDRLLDQTRRRVGLRTVALDQSPDPEEPGATFFRFVLNGVPIFAKGACWVPSTSFVAEVDEAAYRRLIDQTVGANMNMMRVWGGGIYEPDIFYDLCDQKGVLVWQDFMFACAPYPDDDAFVASVRTEAEEQIRRLRHHPCLALWCGNNENQAIHRIAVDVSGQDAPLSGAALYHAVLPDLLNRLDPETPYWPGSPWGGPHPNSMKAGDVHDWTVWHGIPPIPDDHMIEPFGYAPEKIVYQRYAEDRARFVSEFGIQAAPALATLQRWMDPADLEPDSEGLQQRIKDEARKALAMIDPVTGPPTTLSDYVDFTQWTQAEGLKFGIEHFRRRTPHCSGALIWQFNDCWPCVSWSLVDWDGVEKAAYHAVRRAFAPVLASFKLLDDGQVELWITNDRIARVSGQAEIRLDRLDGRSEERRTLDYEVPANRSIAVWSGPIETADDLVLSVRSLGDAFPSNRAFFAPIRQLPLTPGARPHVKIRQTGPCTLEVEVAAVAYLAFVHLTSARSDLRFDDNYFDMAPGARKTVTVSAESEVSPAAIAVRCWNDRGQLGSGVDGAA